MILPEGDRLMRVTIGSSTETSLEVQSDALGKLSVPLDGILGLVVASENQAAELDTLWERVRTEPRSTEVVWLANGDRLAGGFSAWIDSKIKIQVAGKPRSSIARGSSLSVSTPSWSAILGPRPTFSS